MAKRSTEDRRKDKRRWLIKETDGYVYGFTEMMTRRSDMVKFVGTYPEAVEKGRQVAKSYREKREAYGEFQQQESDFPSDIQPDVLKPGEVVTFDDGPGVDMSDPEPAEEVVQEPNSQQEYIREAILMLNKSDDNHFTDEGTPRVKAVHAIIENESKPRASEIHAVWESMQG